MFTCSECGRKIKRPFFVNGQPYGSECIEKITGKNINYWIVKNGVIDEQATQEREQKKQEKLLQKQQQGVRLIENATLEKIESGYQQYKGESGKIYNLTGISKNNHAKTGDKGKILYYFSPSKAYHIFEIEGKEVYKL